MGGIIFEQKIKNLFLKYFFRIFGENFMLLAWEMAELWQLVPKRTLSLSSTLYYYKIDDRLVIIQSNSVEAGRVGQKLSLCRCSNRVYFVSVLVITTGPVRCNFLSEYNESSIYIICYMQKMMFKGRHSPMTKKA